MELKNANYLYDIREIWTSIREVENKILYLLDRLVYLLDTAYDEKKYSIVENRKYQIVVLYNLLHT